MTEKIGYKLNLNKLKGAPQSILPYFVGAFYYTEDFEYFDVIKPYLDIPEKPKTLEEISQEHDENFDELIERTKKKFYGYKLTAERKYERKFDKIFDDFESAKKYGIFPSNVFTYLTYTEGNNITLSGNNITFSGNKITLSAETGVGFYEVGIKEKPTAVSRFFMKLLGLRWVDN